MTIGQKLTLLGAITLIIGMFLPWISVISILGQVSTAGYADDGIFTGVIGVILLLIALLREERPGDRYSVPGAILALIAGLIGIFAFLRLHSAIANIPSDATLVASMGSGIYVTMLGAIFSLIGGLQRLPAIREPSTELPEIETPVWR